MSFYIEPMRIYSVIALLLTYAAMCFALWRGQKRKHQLNPDFINLNAGADDSTTNWLLVYASQTGTAEDLAHQTANTLHLVGVSAHVLPLSALTVDTLKQAERILFFISTYGEGDPPDNGAVFASRVMSGDLLLNHLHYAMLALGDSSYIHHCGFGREVDSWLQQQGAQALFERVEVDCMDESAISHWRKQLNHHIGTTDASDWSAPTFSDWQLADRRLANPGSAGEQTFYLDFVPVDGAPLPDWQSGDLVQIQVAADAMRPREYSIASIPADGKIELLMRLHRNADGSTGLSSGSLGLQVEIGDKVQMRLREHRRFRLEDNLRRPLILIGNGTGLSGLRGHIKARASIASSRNWLIFGERNAAHDFYYREEIEHWKASGVLEQVDMVFSRDLAEGQTRRHYVQDRLLEVGEQLKTWVAQGAAIYVCGSLEGMAKGVDDALATTLGRDALETLSLAGRYRRDVY